MLDKYRLAGKKRPTIRLEDKRKDGNGFEWSGEEMYADVVGSRQSETLQRVDKLDKSLSFAPSVFQRKMPKPITQTQNVMKKLGQTQKGQKMQKMFGCLVHRKFGRIDLIPRNEKRLFWALPCCSFSSFSLGFAYYIRKKKRIDTRHKHRETGRREPGRFGLVERVFLPPPWFSNGFRLVL